MCHIYKYYIKIICTVMYKTHIHLYTSTAAPKNFSSTR